MKKQIDGWCFWEERIPGWLTHTIDFDMKRKPRCVYDKPVRMVDVSDDSKDVVVPRELLETVHIFLKADPKDIDPDEHAAWRKNYSLFLVNKLSEILSEKHDDD